MKKELLKLKDTYYPYAEEVDNLLTNKKVGYATMIRTKSILIRAYMKALEIGFNEGMTWQINKERRAK